MSSKGPKPIVIPGTSTRRLKPVLLHLYVDEWEEFCQGLEVSRSEAVRNLIRKTLHGSY